jgi:1-acyl-sn-glycerol-3-phosphate acyltransferase
MPRFIAVIELHTLANLACGCQDCDRLMGDFLATAYAAVRRILDVEVVLDSTSATPEEIPREEPVIVLSRHCGPGDTVLVAWLLTFEYRLRVRIVLKAVLRCEPVLDLAGDLKCLCFLSRPSERARKQIHDLAASLVGGQALLLFPEGANFSWARWRSAITRLHSAGRTRAASRASRRSHTLPPRTGGATAALAGAPSTNVLVLTHNGFSPDGPGSALVAHARPPATDRPHGSGPGRPASPARSAEPLAGTNLDPSRCLGRRPYRPFLGSHRAARR